MNTPIRDFVARYAESGVSRLHMPGHKGKGPLGCEALDITEVAGADALYEASGIIAESEANAASLFGTRRTLYSTEGSSQCIRAMLYLALTSRGQGNGRPVALAARNAHKAFLFAAALCDFDVEWLYPEEGAGSLCACPVSAAALAARLDEMPRPPGRQGQMQHGPDALGRALRRIQGAARAEQRGGIFFALRDDVSARLLYFRHAVRSVASHAGQDG